MKIRKAEESDMDVVRSLWSYCFEKEGEPFFDWYFQTVQKPGEVLLGEEAGGVACDLHRRPYTLSVRGRAYETDYIVGVATHPAARGQGLAKELIRGAFHLAEKEGKAISILMPSAASFYFPMGFGFYDHHWARSAAPEPLAPLGQRAKASRMVRRPEDWQDLAAVYDAYTAKRNGYALRDEASWQRHIDGALLDDGFIYLAYDEKGPAGYLFYTLEGRTLNVSEMAFATEAGRRALYAFFAGHRGSVDRVTWHEPLDDGSYRYWPDGAEHSYIENKTFPFMLGRVLDPVAAFDGLAVPERLSGEFAFQLIDPFLPGNSGIYVLRAERGNLQAFKEDVFYSLKCHIEDISGLKLGNHIPEPAFSLTANALAELFFGAADLSELLSLDKATWLTQDKGERNQITALADAMLPKQRNWINEWY